MFSLKSWYKLVSREVIIFASVLLVVIALLSAVFLYRVSPLIIIGLAVVVLGAFFAAPRLVEFKEFERGVFFRFGKFRKVAGPGWVLFWPSFESFTLADLRVCTIDLAKQAVITRDDVEIKVDAIVYEKIVDPKKAVVEIKNYREAMTELLRSQIRNTVSKMELEEVLEKTEEVANELNSVLKTVAQEWGIQVVKVEVQSIELPPSLITAMHKRREAGEYKIKLETEAQARQLSLDILDKATSKMSDNTISYLYLESLKSIANGRATKIVIPIELSTLASALSNKISGNAGANSASASNSDALATLASVFSAAAKKETQKK